MIGEKSITRYILIEFLISDNRQTAIATCNPELFFSACPTEHVSRSGGDSRFRGNDTKT